MKRDRAKNSFSGGQKQNRRAGSRSRNFSLLLAVAAAGIGLTVLGGGPGRSFGTYVSAQTRGSAINIKGYEQSGDQKITPEGQRQIAALMEEKESRTPAQQKIDSNILFEIKKHRGQEIARGVATLETGLDIDENNGLKVDIHADVSRGLLEEIRDGGGIIMDSLAAYHSILAWLPLDKIERLAERADIKFVRPHADGQVWKNNSAANDIPSAIWNKDRTPALVKLSEMTGPGPSFAERAQRVQEYLRARLDGIVPEVGSQQSQGDTTHAANTYRSTIGPDGAGLKIGVLSNGVVSLAASQALGDLGPVTVLPGQVGTGDEGTAMLEIVHDLAPGAQLYFATANPLPARFASNVRDLRAAGCDIIIDDVFYFVETPFQDGQLTPSNSNGGVVIQAVKDVTAAGAMYFSSAGNQGNQDDNTASCYQGDWADGGVLALAVGGNVHDFGAGAQSDLIQTGSGNRIDLYWADPLNGSNNDYDLYVFNNALGAVVASSTNVQTGTQDPFEEVATGNTTNNRVVVLKKTGAANRFFHITINANGVGKLGTSTNGTTKGHSIPVDAYSVSATPAAAPGPFPAAHSAANVSETFTSDGPRRIFFSENGTAFTPGNFSSTGGILRQKPDITAADRVSVTGVGGFPTTFSGTSAAAPHAGAIAALLKSGLPTPTNAQIRTALLNSAIDIETAGVDRDTGVGIIMPIPAAGLLGITSQASVDKTGFTFTERPGNSDGDGQVEKGERANLVITSLINTGAQTATGVTASVTSNTAGVTTVPGSPLAPESLAYPNIGGAGGTGSNANPYTFVLGPAYVCGSPINFTLTVTYNDGSAKTKIINFTVDPSAGFAAADTVDVTPPASTAFYTGATGTQVNRVTRDSQSSTCSNPKAAFPGTTLATTPGWDSYTFTAPQSGCTVVTFSGGPTVAGGTQTFSTVYQGSFVPASIGTNYVADAGSSPTAGTSFSYSFNAVAGTQYVVVISTVPGTAPNPPYTLSVKGPGTTVCNFAPATAASVNISGRVLTSGGIPIRNASVVLQDGNNNVRYAITSSLGYYTFEDVPIGDYVIGVSSKRYNFSPRLLNVLSEVQDADLIADPE